MRLQINDTTLQTLKDLAKADRNLSITLHYADHKSRVSRLFVSGDYLGVKNRGSRRYGTFFDKYSLKGVEYITIPDKRKITPEQKWRKSWDKVVARLEASGLWVDYLENLKTTLDIGYEKLQAAHREYWNRNSETDRITRIRAIDPRFIWINSAGEEYVSIEDSFTRPAKVKKMYFGKYKNEHVLRGIADAFANQREHEVWGDNGYDVSFEYKPGRHKAWYSEEYKGTGNGHYYIALDATHALFMEDD